MLDCVIPMVMHVIYDFGGYVEKNTGDGVMGILTGKDDETSLPALEIALTVFYLLNKLINPYLLSHGIPGVDARIGIDVGRLLLARIGTPKGSAKQDRNFLTAIGPTANIACHLQQMAETNQIWVGDIVKTNSPSAWQDWFIDVTPQNDWGWNYTATGNTYRVWHFHAHRPDVEMPSRPSLLSSLFIPKS
ncbi:adenylate/guanylate cyclase domain-containing protein [Nitrospira sp. Nam74]